MITYKRKLSFSLLFKQRGNQQIKNFFPASSEPYYCSAVRLGLLDVFQSLELKKNEYILIPPICPQGIVLPLQKKKIAFRFYHLSENFSIDINSVNELITAENCKAIFFIHYFGIYNPQIQGIRKICTENNVLLFEDSVHGLFSRNDDGQLLGSMGDISFYSLSKFLPVPDGAVFFINNQDIKINFKCKRSLLNSVSVFFHTISLLTNSFISRINNKLIRKLVKLFSLFNYTIYYYLLMSENSNAKVSDTTLRIISNLNFDEFIGKKKKVFDLYNSVFGFYDLNKNTPISTGYPVMNTENNSREIKKELFSLGVEAQSYIKGWNYIPDLPEYQYERELLNSHFLLPLDIDCQLFL